MIHSAARAFWNNKADRGGFNDDQYLRVLRYQREIEDHKNIIPEK